MRSAPAYDWLIELLKRSFRSFVPANLEANRVGSRCPAVPP